MFLSQKANINNDIQLPEDIKTAIAKSSRT